VKLAFHVLDGAALMEKPALLITKPLANQTKNKPFEARAIIGLPTQAGTAHLTRI
jgi:hypothetical protein